MVAMGHGSNEGNYEGWYTGGVDSADAGGKTVKVTQLGFAK